MKQYDDLILEENLNITNNIKVNNKIGIGHNSKGNEIEGEDVEENKNRTKPLLKLLKLILKKKCYS